MENDEKMFPEAEIGSLGSGATDSRGKMCRLEQPGDQGSRPTVVRRLSPRR
jgi:hypothetical protein